MTKGHIAVMAENSKAGWIVMLPKIVVQLIAAFRCSAVQGAPMAIAPSFNMVKRQEWYAMLPATGTSGCPARAIAGENIHAQSGSLYPVPFPAFLGVRFLVGDNCRMVALLASVRKAVLMPLVPVKIFRRTRECLSALTARLGRLFKIEYYLRCHVVHAPYPFVNDVITARSRGASLVRAFSIIAQAPSGLGLGGADGEKFIRDNS
jgi:hypothetical protein